MPLIKTLPVFRATQARALTIWKPLFSKLSKRNTLFSVKYGKKAREIMCISKLKQELVDIGETSWNQVVSHNKPVRSVLSGFSIGI